MTFSVKSNEMDPDRELWLLKFSYPIKDLEIRLKKLNNLLVEKFWKLGKYIFLGM